MNFKDPKAVVISNAFSAAQMVVNSQMHNYDDQPTKSHRFMIERAISEGIKAAIESLVEDIYTDEEFERDLTLRT